MQEDALDRIFNSSSLIEEVALESKCAQYTCIIFVSARYSIDGIYPMFSGVKIGNLYNSHSYNIYKPSKREVDIIIINKLKRHLSRIVDFCICGEISAIDDFKLYDDILGEHQNYIYITPTYGWSFEFNSKMKSHRECLKLLLYLKWCFMEDTVIYFIDKNTGNKFKLIIESLSLEHGWFHQKSHKSILV